MCSPGIQEFSDIIIYSCAHICLKFNGIQGRKKQETGKEKGNPGE